MKKLLFSIVISVIALSTKAQTPQKVHSIVTERHEVSWYLVQKDLWKKETEKDKKNGEAWYNYYSAARALRNLNWENKEEYAKFKEECDEITKQAFKSAPETFEANHLMWWNSGNDLNYVKYLNIAFEINPNDSRILVDKLTQAELTGDKINYTKYLEQYYKTNEIPSRILNWAHNILSEVDRNAVLFTAGDNDTYSIWLIQEAKKYRQDVKVINTSLIMKDDYRKMKFEELGITALEISTESAKTEEEYLKNNAAVFSHIFNNGKRPVYVSVSAAQFFTEEYSEYLHLTGLAYKYSVAPIDNLSLLVRNFEKRFLIDHLTESFTFTISEKIADNMDGLYLPGLTKLYKHYISAEEVQKAAEVKVILLSVAEKCGKLDSILEIVK